MNRGAFAVTLTCGRICRRPIGVVHAQRGTIPGALLQHLRNRRIVEIKAMLYGVATAVQGTLQANSTIDVACDFLAPSVRFINDGLQFFYGERWLRNQFAIFPQPGAMGHVNLNPIRAVIELFAGCLTCFDWPINELRSLRHIEFRSIVFQRITAGRRDSASRNK